MVSLISLLTKTSEIQAANKTNILRADIKNGIGCSPTIQQPDAANS